MRSADLPPEFRYLRGWWVEPETLDTLLTEVAWEDHDLRIFGRAVRMPRRIAWQGDLPYAYSGITHPAAPMTPTVRALHARVQQTLGQPYNAVLLNLYRDGQDSMGWHHDADYPDGGQPCIASVSLGAARRFSLRSRVGGPTIHLDLEPGSLLWMGPDAQARWSHALPKTRRPTGVRINLTFRHLARR